MAVQDGKHEVAFAAGKLLGAALGSGFYCCICAVKLGCKQERDGRISKGHECLVEAKRGRRYVMAVLAELG